MSKTKKLTSKEMEKIVKAYRSGCISKELVAALEEANNSPIADIIIDMEDYLNTRKYCVDSMTVTALKKLMKSHGRLTASERFTYEKYSGCSFEEVLTRAAGHIAAFEERKIQIQHAKEERQKQRIAFASAFSLDLVDEIEGELSKYFDKTTLLSSISNYDFATCHFMSAHPHFSAVPEPGNNAAATTGRSFAEFTESLLAAFKERFGADTMVEIRNLDGSGYDCFDIEIKAARN